MREQTARLNLYDSVDGIIEHAQDIGGKVGESLRENIETLRMSQQLATIKLDVDLPLAIDDLQPAPADSSSLKKIYGRYELRTLLRQLDEQDQQNAPDAAVDTAPTVSDKGDYESVLDWETFDRWMN